MENDGKAMFLRLSRRWYAIIFYVYCRKIPADAAILMEMCEKDQRRQDKQRLYGALYKDRP